ncbi:MAG: Lrp/AsnC family transcriptional regulator [Candidatus Freyarchaeota archaeon]|nr:Lrp/AsnC family transcriptional regulator [Candidatus Freyrarchaeum guaymaensis]
MEIDTLDVEILKILQKDSRIPFTQIAKTLNVPDTTIHFRVRKLVEKGIIRKFTVAVSAEKLGYNALAMVRLMVGGHIVKDLTVKRTREIAENLIKNDYIRLIGIGDEGNEVYLIAIARTNEELERIISGFRRSPDVQEVNVWYMNELLKGEEIIGLIPEIAEEER